MEQYFKIKFITEYIIPIIVIAAVIIGRLLLALIEYLLTKRKDRIRKMNEKFWEAHGGDDEYNGNH